MKIAKGAECRVITEDLIKALGDVITTENTEEYFEEKVVNVQHVRKEALNPPMPCTSINSARKMTAPPSIVQNVIGIHPSLLLHARAEAFCCFKSRPIEWRFGHEDVHLGSMLQRYSIATERQYCIIAALLRKKSNV